MSDELRARRCYAINEMLIRIMCEQVKKETDKLFAAGHSFERLNEILPSIVFYYDTWREETLALLLAEFDDPQSPRSTDDVTARSPN